MVKHFFAILLVNEGQCWLLYRVVTDFAVHVINLLLAEDNVFPEPLNIPQVRLFTNFKHDLAEHLFKEVETIHSLIRLIGVMLFNKLFTVWEASQYFDLGGCGKQASDNLELAVLVERYVYEN